MSPPPPPYFFKGEFRVRDGSFERCGDFVAELAGVPRPRESYHGVDPRVAVVAGVRLQVASRRPSHLLQWEAGLARDLLAARPPGRGDRAHDLRAVASPVLLEDGSAGRSELER